MSRGAEKRARRRFRIDAGRRDHILEAIEDVSREYGHSPSVRALMGRVGLASTSAVHHHLAVLERDGLIYRCGCGCGKPMLAEVIDLRPLAPVR